MRSGNCRAADRRETGHFFLCRPCRVEARVAAAWKRFVAVSAARPEILEQPSEQFVRRAVAAISEDRRRRLRRRALLSAAAALAFFFLAGAAGESRAGEKTRAADSYAQLLTPSSLETLLPE